VKFKKSSKSSEKAYTSFEEVNRRFEERYKKFNAMINMKND